MGNGTTDNVTSPHKVQGIEGNIKEIITGTYFSTVYVITDSGLYAWGENWQGTVGNGENGWLQSVATPYKIKEITSNIKEIIIDEYTVYVVTDDGLYIWGNNQFGQVGNGESGSNVIVATPYKAVNGNIKECIAGDSYSPTYVMTDDGLYAWGYNKDNQVGNGKTENVLTPYKVAPGNFKDFIVVIYANSNNNKTYYVVTDDGLYIWGSNRYGEAGNGSTSDVLTPHKVEGIDGNIKELILNDYTVYAITNTALYAWGINEFGQVGNGTTAYRVLTPYKVKIKKQN